MGHIFSTAMLAQCQNEQANAACKHSSVQAIPLQQLEKEQGQE